MRSIRFASALIVLLAGVWVAQAPAVPLKPEAKPDPSKPVVVMETSHGPITIELYLEKAPLTVKNFLQYVDDKHYDGTIFHRVIAEFMIQAGGFDRAFEEKKTRAPIKCESDNGLSNERGTIAAARTNDPDSATAQFYINVKDNAFLDHGKMPGRAGYAVFGKVIDGMQVIDEIRRVPTGMRGGHGDVPLADVVIRSIRRKP